MYLGKDASGRVPEEECQGTGPRMEVPAWTGTGVEGDSLPQPDVNTADGNENATYPRHYHMMHGGA